MIREKNNERSFTNRNPAHLRHLVGRGNDHNDGYVQKGYRDKLDVVYKNLLAKHPRVKFEETKEEMCF